MQKQKNITREKTVLSRTVFTLRIGLTKISVALLPE